MPSVVRASAGRARALGLPDVAGAESEDEIARGRGLLERVDAAVHCAHVYGAFVAELAHALDEGFGGDALNGFFGGGVNIHDEDGVGLVEAARELVQ